MARHFPRRDVHLVDLGLVLDVHVQAAGAVGDAGLGLAGERDVGHVGAGLRVDHGRRAGVAVHREYISARRIVDNAVVVVHGSVDLARHLERLEIDDADGAVSARGGEGAADGVHERHAVRPVEAGNLGEHLPAAGSTTDTRSPRVMNRWWLAGSSVM